MFSSHRPSNLCFPATTLCKTAGQSPNATPPRSLLPRARRFKSNDYNLPCHRPPFFFLSFLSSHALSARAWLDLNPALAQLKRHRLSLPSLIRKDGSQDEADVPTEGWNELKPLMWSASKRLSINASLSRRFLCLRLLHRANGFTRGNSEKSQAEPFSSILFFSHLLLYSRERNQMEFPSFENK